MPAIQRLPPIVTSSSLGLPTCRVLSSSLIASFSSFNTYIGDSIGLGSRLVVLSSYVVLLLLYYRDGVCSVGFVRSRLILSM